VSSVASLHRYFRAEIEARYPAGARA
jgi:hypothetical protein